MRGTVLSFSTQESQGVISGDDGKRYNFLSSDWNLSNSPSQGVRVDFDVDDNHAISIYEDPNATIASDRLLFAKFLEQFPYQSQMIELLRDEDFQQSFSSKPFEEINCFIQEWNDALHEFINPTLEAKRSNFMLKLISFREGVWNTTWVLENRDSRSTLSENFKEEDPRWEKVEELSNMGTEAHNAHQELVRACKAMLGHPEAS